MTISRRQAAIFGAGLALGVAGAWFAFGNRQGPAAGPAPTAGAVSPAAPASTAAAAAPCPAQVTTALGDAKDGQFQLQSDVSGKTEKEAAAFIVVGKEAAASGRARDAEVAFMMACRVAEQHKGTNPLPAADARYQLAWHYANLAQQGGGGTQRTELLRRAERLYAESLSTYRASHGENHEKTRFAAQGLAALRPAAGDAGRTVTTQAPGPLPGKAPATASPEPTQAQTQARAQAQPQGQAQTRTPVQAQAGAAAQPQPRAQVQTQGQAPAAAAAAPARVQTPAAPPAASTRVQTAPLPVPARRVEPPAVARTAPAQATMGAPAQAQGSADGLAVARTGERVGVAQGSATGGGSASGPVRPSFDCAKARSRSERIICSDAELARQDRELGRLYARARDAAPDSAAFRRQNEQEWQRREATCGDRECLLRWYAQRRSQLSGSAAPAPP